LDIDYTCDNVHTRNGIVDIDMFTWIAIVNCCVVLSRLCEGQTSVESLILAHAVIHRKLHIW
jgi:hypothetical protein